MNSIFRRPQIIGLLVVAAVLWVLISRGTRQATWLQVETGEEIAVGGTVPVAITLPAPAPGAFIRCDLHWRDARRVPQGMLSTVGAQPIRAGQRVYRFNLPVPARFTPAYIYGVIYISPTGRWSDRTQVCTLEPFVVGPPKVKAGTNRLHRVAAYDQPLGPPPKRPDSRGMRWLSALLWACAGALCARMQLRLRGVAAAGPANATVRRWTWLTLACLLAAIWEASTAEAQLGELLRRIAVAHDWYEHRRHLQEVLTVVVVAAATVVAALALRRDHAQPVALVFSSVDIYWTVAAVSFISLHDADAWLATPLYSLPIGQVVKLAAALIAVSGATRTLAPGQNPPA